MSDAYINHIFNSDLDAFKQSGFSNSSITFSGALGAGAELFVDTPAIVISSVDYSQILFDNSFYHPGRYKNLSLENATMINETTFGSQLQCNVSLIVSGSTVKLRGYLNNPYGSVVNMSTTTINFKFIPYQATI